METRPARRPLTHDRVKALLAACIIPALGPNKLSIVGRGNPFVREDGTAVVIFNVQAFASHDDAKAAAAAYKAGKALELGGDIDGAQVSYKEAMNKMMSFNVRQDNAADFGVGYQIVGVVENVPTRAGGTKLGINNVRAVAVATNGNSAADLFNDEEAIEDLTSGGKTEPSTELPSATTQQTRQSLNLRQPTSEQKQA